jgi:hypothetical protein
MQKLLEVYWDDLTILSLLKNHLQVLRLMLDRCRQMQRSFNLIKCRLVRTPFGIILGHTVCKEGLLVDLAKIRERKALIEQDSLYWVCRVCLPVRSKAAAKGNWLGFWREATRINSLWFLQEGKDIRLLLNSYNSSQLFKYKRWWKKKSPVDWRAALF